jgi:hypothetical protein
MRWFKILRATLGLIYFFAIISTIASPFYFFLAGSGAESKFNLGGIVVQNINWLFYIVLGLVIISQFLFVLMIYHMKKASWLLNPSTIINLPISAHFNKAGLYCIAGALLNRVPPYIYRYANIQEFTKLGLNDSAMNMGFSFDSMLVVISFGIFIIITSKILKISALIKEENDLTI